MSGQPPPRLRLGRRVTSDEAMPSNDEVRRARLNPKLEYRISKQNRNHQIQNSNLHEYERLGDSGFEISYLFRISKFGFRYF
jgi:hypothetical protein